MSMILAVGRLFEGEVLSARAGKLDEGIRLLAGNDMPEDLLCLVCKKAPEEIFRICLEFYYEGECRKAQTCEDDEMMMPVINSPRMGVFGYCDPSG